MDDFWGEVGSRSGHSAQHTMRLFKNLGQDYQKIKQSLHVSGVETEVEPTMRNSHELYLAYEYYQLYYPQGGSTLPQLVMTENSVKLLVQSDSLCSSSITTKSQETSAAGPVPKSDNAPAPSCSAFACTKIALRKATKPIAKKRKIPYDGMQVLTGLQNRQLQLERERLRVEREKLTALQGIQSELTAIKLAICHSAGVSVSNTRAGIVVLLAIGRQVVTSERRDDVGVESSVRWITKHNVAMWQVVQKLLQFC